MPILEADVKDSFPRFENLSLLEDEDDSDDYSDSDSDDDDDDDDDDTDEEEDEDEDEDNNATAANAEILYTSSGCSRRRRRRRRKHKDKRDRDALPPDLEALLSDEESDETTKSDCNNRNDKSKKRKFISKEEEDVNMFRGLIDKMSVQTVLFLLQNHAREMHNIPQAQLQQALLHDQQQQQAQKQQQRKARGGNAVGDTNQKSLSSSTPTPPMLLRVKKKFRFADILGGQKVRAQVLEIPRAADFTVQEKEAIWWTKAEQAEFRNAAISTVRFYMHHRPKYSESVEYLSHSFDPEQTDCHLVEQLIKKMANTMEHSYPRGLECHIVRSLPVLQQEAIQAVMDEQFTTVSEDVPTEESWQRIARIYMAASLPSKTLALKLAQSDHMEALNACLSTWNTNATAATTTTTTTNMAMNGVASDAGTVPQAQRQDPLPLPIPSPALLPPPTPNPLTPLNHKRRIGKFNPPIDIASRPNKSRWDA